LLPEAALAAGLLAAPARGPSPADGYLGTVVCAGCHAEIAKAYGTHAMARSSGRLDQPKAPRIAPAEFTHALSGIRYSVRQGADGRLRITYERPGGTLRGEVEAGYYTGGRKGLSFVYLRDSYLYQAPVTYYLTDNRWDVSPGYEDRATMTLSRPAQAKCVECHASGSTAVPGTLNRFLGEPFREAGISCERCHGPGREHRDRVLRGGSGDLRIVNPGRLAPERRDSVCAQCHLRAESQVQRKGCGLAEFRPGDSLAEIAPPFVWAGDRRRLDATSHYEKLWQSRCHEKAGSRLWCVTCHDPHRPVLPASRLSHFRNACLTCHEDAACQATRTLRASRQDDCVACHMPKRRNETVAHTVATDHAIPRFAEAPNPPPSAPVAKRELVPFWGGAPGARDLGLAYASLVKDREAYRERAEELLRRAYGEGARDAQTLILLGTYLEAAGAPAKALPLYREALDGGGGCSDELSVAENRLGALLAAQGRVADAIRLFEQALFRAPVYEAARMNLARARVAAGQRAEAKQTVSKALEIEPDSALLQQVAGELRQELGP
jgi:Tetratricopeptide repeat/Cytochrome c554 and c-prime